jgi:probable rRNA maturation factor
MNISSHDIQVTDRQQILKCDPAQLKAAILRTFESQLVSSSEVSLVLVNNAEIHQINRQFLEHDEPTDVITFDLSDPDEFQLDDAEFEDSDELPPPAPAQIQGEIIVSTEMAIEKSVEIGWPPQTELLFYIIHGALHLCGFLDATQAERDEMFRLQYEILKTIDSNSGSVRP